MDLTDTNDTKSIEKINGIKYIWHLPELRRDSIVNNAISYNISFFEFVSLLNYHYRSMVGSAETKNLQNIPRILPLKFLSSIKIISAPFSFNFSIKTFVSST